MNVDAYLDRIGYRGSREPTAETLRRLHLAHLESVPFENLGIHAGEPIVLDDEALYDKVVTRRRGGFCYELNGLFAALLRALGFGVDVLSANVARETGVFTPDFDHMALKVSLDRPWLADVGFGDSFREPLLLDEREEQSQGSEAFRIDSEGDWFLVMRLRPGEDWRPQYRFTLNRYAYADFEEMCRFHQTSPESHFTQKRICSLATARGCVTLSGMTLMTTHNGRRLERPVKDEDEYAQILHDVFGMTMKV